LAPAVLRRALNAFLPPDIRVINVDPAPDGFHAIRDAVRKTYRYQIQFGRIANVFLRRHYWHVRGELDVARMRHAAGHLIGQHDFSSFQAVGAERATTVRNINQLDLVERAVDGFDELWILISANGFLYNMARNIVGSLVLVGLQKKPVEWLESVLAARDRRLAGPTAPARGLVLLRVEYEF
jgi:tRNA pseudouridine38-40 synthase